MRVLDAYCAPPRPDRRSAPASAWRRARCRSLGSRRQVIRANLSCRLTLRSPLPAEPYRVRCEPAPERPTDTLFLTAILPMKLADHVKHSAALVGTDGASSADPLAHCPHPAGGKLG